MNQVDNDLDLMVVGSTIARQGDYIGMLTEARYTGREDSQVPIDYDATRRAIESILRDLRAAHRYICHRVPGSSFPRTAWDELAGK